MEESRRVARDSSGSASAYAFVLVLILCQLPGEPRPLRYPSSPLRALSNCIYVCLHLEAPAERMWRVACGM